MKPKLLITLGCSLTEGVGCYNLDLLPKNPNQDYFLDLKLEKHSKRFLKYGWPNVLGNHLNYDLVINMVVISKILYLSGIVVKGK